MQYILLHLYLFIHLCSLVTLYEFTYPYICMHINTFTLLYIYMCVVNLCWLHFQEPYYEFTHGGESFDHIKPSGRNRNIALNIWIYQEKPSCKALRYSFIYSICPYFQVATEKKIYFSHLCINEITGLGLAFISNNICQVLVRIKSYSRPH